MRHHSYGRESSVSRSMSRENGVLAKRLLMEIREMLIRFTTLHNPLSRRTNMLLQNVLESDVIDSYPGQTIGFSDLILALGRWPVAEQCRTRLRPDRRFEIRWNPIPGIGENSGDEVILICGEVIDGELWIWTERAGRRSDGGVNVDCSYVGYHGEINCWITFSLEERPGEYAENEYLGWVDFTSKKIDHERA